MPKKLLLFGGVTVASVTTLTPGGIFLQKAIKTKQMKKERQEFVSKSGKLADGLNARFNGGGNVDVEVTFLKDSPEQENEWKLMWIWDVFKYYKTTLKKSLKYEKTEMEEAEGIYWKEALVDKKGIKWKDKVTEERLQKANTKNQYWEKFKEMFQILIHDGQIEETNALLYQPDLWLCNLVEGTHTIYLASYETYKNGISSPMGIMEHFWTVQAKQSGSSST